MTTGKPMIAVPEQAPRQDAATRGLFDSLRKLDERLLRLVAAMRAQTGREPGADPFRGLYVSETDVLKDLSGRESRIALDLMPMAASGQFAALSERYRLSQYELDTLLVALAPDIEPSYERIFAYLQDDVSCKRPCVDLVLSLLSRSPADKLVNRTWLSASSRLVRNRLVTLAGDEWAPLPRREVRIDARVAAFLMGDSSLDSRLAEFTYLIDAQTVVDHSGADPVDAGLADLARTTRTDGAPLVIYFRGTDEEEKRRAAAALASEVDSPLLIADVARASQRSTDFDELLRVLSREAVFQGAVAYYEGLDTLAHEGARESVLRGVRDDAGITILSGFREWRPSTAWADGVITVSFETPDWQVRRRAWQAVLGHRALHPRGQVLDAVAECFRFNNSQIAGAALTASRLAKYRQQRLSMDHVFEAARERSGTDMGNLARKVRGTHGWDDLVLPAESLEQLHEICRRVTLRHRVLGKWGFGRKLSGGKGVNALFHGHAGTGKSMAAEVIAKELELDLYKIDLAGVVSKYIGETEKNLDRIFSAAENTNVILLFDEADALFGKRSEVRDSHDRYANLEISYLLQKMEQYEGLSLLATNLRKNLDDAFIRRLAFTVPFPFPDDASRRRIWDGIWPKETPLGIDVDHGWLAARFLLSGGNIRNAALAAAYLAAHEQTPVAMTHVLHAIRSEFLKMGKTLTASELALPERTTTGGRA
jgi:hypothetical protein